MKHKITTAELFIHQLTEQLMQAWNYQAPNGWTDWGIVLTKRGNLLLDWYPDPEVSLPILAGSSTLAQSAFSYGLVGSWAKVNAKSIVQAALTSIPTSQLTPAAVTAAVKLLNTVILDFDQLLFDMPAFSGMACEATKQEPPRNS